MPWSQPNTQEPPILPLTDPVLVFSVVLAVILLAPRLAQAVRVPGVVGLIVAGMVLGPNAAGLLERDETITLLGTVGLLYIIFIAGLELDLGQFNKYRHRSLTFGLISFLIPTCLGAVAIYGWLGFSWPVAILLGSMLGSHTLLAYPIVSQLGLAKREPVTIAVGGTMVTDTGALLVLAVIAALTQGELSAVSLAGLFGGIAVFTVAVFVLLPLLGSWFFRLAGTDSGAEFLFVLSVSFGCAYLAGLAGAQPILGAFFAGLALNRLIPESSTLMIRLKFAGSNLFIPIFLISTGMLLDARGLFISLETWRVAAVMIAMVLLTKWLAAWLTARMFGYSADDGWVIYGLSLSQAAATLAAVLVGYQIGLFDERILNATIIMIVVTCFVAPAIAERYGRRLAIKEAAKPAAAGTPQQRILVPLANPATADAIMDLAIMLRDPASTNPIHPLRVTLDSSNVEEEVARAEAMLSHSVTYAAAADIPVSPTIRVDLNVASGVFRAVKELRITTLVVGWDGRPDASRLLFGSVLDQLVVECEQKVIVARLTIALNTTKRLILLVPPFAERERDFDGTIAEIKRLSKQLGAPIRVVSTSLSQEDLAGRVGKIKPEATLEFDEAVSWPDSRRKVFAEATKDDLVVLLGARRGTVSYQPGLERLPRTLAERLPETGFLIVYPPLETLDHPSGERRLEGVAALLPQGSPRGGVFLDLSAAAHEQAVEIFLKDVFHHQPALIPPVFRQILETAREYPTEVSPGVVLLHARCPQVTEHRLLVGLSPRGLSFPLIEKPAEVVFLVLTPSTQPAEHHLRTLAAVAAFIRSPGLMERLQQAKSRDDVVDVLSRASAPGLGIDGVGES